MPRSMRAACATAARSWFKSAAVFILSPSTPGISWRLLHLTRRVTIHFFGQGTITCAACLTVPSEIADELHLGNIDRSFAQNTEKNHQILLHAPSAARAEYYKSGVS